MHKGPRKEKVINSNRENPTRSHHFEKHLNKEAAFVLHPCGLWVSRLTSLLCSQIRIVWFSLSAVLHVLIYPLGWFGKQLHGRSQYVKT